MQIDQLQEMDWISTIFMNTILTEEQDQRLLVEWMDLMIGCGKDIKYTHIPNSTYTKSWNQKRKNKYMGVRAGFPDLVLIVNGRVLFIEMKRMKGSVISPEQDSWLKALAEAGQAVFLCYGYDHAKQVVETFL